MNGETDIDRLIRGLSAHLVEGTFVFVTVSRGDVPTGLDPVMTFQEAEGTTLILPKDAAEKAGLAYEFPSRMITLEIHSSLEAVGFLARITNALAAANMGVNPVSGYFHDHLFVPVDRADDAMRVLANLGKGAEPNI